MVPLVKPETVIGPDVPVAVIAPGLQVAVYPLTVAPPVEAGGVNSTVTAPLPAVTLPVVGGAGGVR